MAKSGAMGEWWVPRVLVGKFALIPTSDFGFAACIVVVVDDATEVQVRLWERQHCRQPGLRPHHLLSGQKPWDDGVLATVRLLQGSEK